MLIGYARVSTGEQNTDLQIKALKEAKCKQIHEEAASGAAERPVLEQVLRSLKPGDVLLAYKVDRLARSLYDLMRVFRAVEAAGATFKSLTEPIETTTAVGRLMVQMLGAFAEFERALIRERCAAGMVAAREKGTRFGRPPKLTDEQRAGAAARIKAGEPVDAVAQRFGVSEETILRIAGRKKQAVYVCKVAPKVAPKAPEATKAATSARKA